MILILFLGGIVEAEDFQWKPLCEPGSGGAIVAVSVDPNDPKRILISGDMLGVGYSTDAGQSWQPSTGFSCFEDGSFSWHPTDHQTVWLGTASGPYVSHDGGKTWTERRDGFPPPAGFGRSAPVEKILFDPKDAHRLLAIGGSSRHGTAGRSRCSASCGKASTTASHWTKLSDIGRHNFWLAEYTKDGSKTYGVADTVGLLESVDSGRSWQPIRCDGLPTNVGRIVVDPINPLRLWTAISDYKLGTSRHPGGVFRSLDGGRHWSDCSTGLAQTNTGRDNLISRYEGLAISPVDPRRLYVSDTAWNGGVIYTSDDGGDHWHAVAGNGNVGNTGGAAPFTPKTAYFAGLSMGLAVCSPTDPATAYFVNTEFILGTTDAGKTFTDLTSLPTGDGWRGRGYSGLCAEHFGFNPYRKGQSIAQAMDAAKVWISDDDLHSWRYPIVTPDPWFGGEDCAFTRDGHIYAAFGQYGFYGIGASDDFGKTWKLQAGPGERFAPDSRRRRDRFRWRLGRPGSRPKRLGDRRREIVSEHRCRRALDETKNQLHAAFRDRVQRHDLRLRRSQFVRVDRRRTFHTARRS